ncbi:MAG: glutathione peroxidase [Bdellovibrionota bacterium]
MSLFRIGQMLRCWLLAVSVVVTVTQVAADDATPSAYSFRFKPLTGTKDIALEDFRGKVILVVNTASHCGFTKQYAALQKLYEAQNARGLVIVGVPSNDFGEQEPGSDAEIASFCKLNYGVTFPMAGKTEVVGASAHPFYAWAAKVLGVAPQWNFHKYLIDRSGKLVSSFNSLTSPQSKTLTEAVENALGAP